MERSGLKLLSEGVFAEPTGRPPLVRGLRREELCPGELVTRAPLTSGSDLSGDRGSADAPSAGATSRRSMIRL